MPWARFDDRFPSNRKIRKLSDGAFRLYVSAICWSGENLTDGFIADDDLMIAADVRDPESAAEELVRRELWEIVPGGWFIHDYFDYNPRAAQVKAERESKSARQQRWRDNKRNVEFGISSTTEDADVDASTDASRDGDVDASVEGAPRARVPVPTRTRPHHHPGGGGGNDHNRHAAELLATLEPAHLRPGSSGKADELTNAVAERLAAGASIDAIRRDFEHNPLPRDQITSPAGFLLGRLKSATAYTSIPAARSSEPSDWCGKCDEHSRLREIDDDTLARCPECNPIELGKERTP